jgi:hypothetical protein
MAPAAIILQEYIMSLGHKASECLQWQWWHFGPSTRRQHHCAPAPLLQRERIEMIKL